MPDEFQTPAPQPMLSPETLQDGPWFESVRKAYEVRTRPVHLSPWVVPLIGFSIAGLLWWFGFRKTAVVGAVIVAVMTELALFQPVVSGKVQRALAIFGTWVGQFLGWALLAPLFFIVGPLSRVFTRVMGADPLGRRMAKAPSYWHFAADEKTRTRKTGSMFCVERRAAGGRNWLGALMLLGFVGLVAGELVFRFWFGFHNPLLYMHDTHSGYRLRPNQDIRTGRGGVQVNNHAMRYHRDVTPEKPAGVYRVIVFSDSTGFGGEYHTNEQTYPGLMEFRLNKQHGNDSRKFEVLPVTVNGWGPHHALGYVNKYGVFSADLALVTIPAGDIDRPLTVMSSTRYLAAKPTFAWETVLVMGCNMVKERIAMGGRDYVHDAAEGYRQHAEGAKAFLNLGLAIKAKGCPEVIYESQPQMCCDQNAIKGTIKEKGKFAEYYNRVKAQIEPAGMQMEIPQTLFKGMAEKEIFHDTGHLAAKGHDLYADYLIGQLAARSASFRKFAGLPEPTEPRKPNLPEPTP